MNSALPCSSLSLYFECFPAHSKVFTQWVFSFVKKRKGAHLFLTVLENVWEQLSPPPFLVFWDKVSLLCLGGLGTHYAVNSNWLWTWDLLLSLLSDRLWVYTAHMTLWGNFFYTAWGTHQTSNERLLLSIIIQIPRRIHRTFLSCGIFSIQYFCAVQVHRRYDYCLVICFLQWTRIPRVQTVPFTYVHLAFGTTPT